VTDRSFLNELGTELARVGVRGARQERIIAEFADHLSCDPDADLGDPRVLVGEFADGLGTSFARTAAFRAFLALALAGLLIAVRGVTLLSLGTVSLSTGDAVALVISALAGQVAVVAGGLGLLRAIGLRGRGSIPRREAAVLSRRAGVGLAAGAVTIVTFPIAQSYTAHPGALSIGSHSTNLWWPLASAVGLIALLAAVPAVIRAARVRPRADGQAGDLLADLGPLQPAAARISGGSVNRLALGLATGLAIVVAVTGVAASDPYDGILRGLLEAGAFLGGYAVLGRYLGIRH
jgi:hypothetical protein